MVISFIKQTSSLSKISSLGMRSAVYTKRKKKALKSADFKAFGAAGQYSFALSFREGAERQSGYLPVCALATAQATGLCDFDSNLPAAERKTATPTGWLFYVELLGRFELPTSSLPRMRSTY